jgi:nucleoside-diphosphate-sugar epimerase
VKAHIPDILLVFPKRRILPSIQSPLGALPARFRRERLLIVGCGDIGVRLARVQRHVKLIALTSNDQRKAELRAQGITPLVGNLDDTRTLMRLAGVATRVVHLAPTSTQGTKDSRSTHLRRSMSVRTPPKQWVYASTSGVYGDCEGALVSETRGIHPQTTRAKRRADAEAQWLFWGRQRDATVSVLRVPGIYALDRVGGSPLERLKRGTPVLAREDDVFTNHIHADDLARAVQLALWRGKPQRVYNINDDTQLRMGDYFDLAAQLFGLEPPQRMTRAHAQEGLPALLLSFMSESRRMRNTRMKQELRLRLRYPTVEQGLRT